MVLRPFGRVSSLARGSSFALLLALGCHKSHGSPVCAIPAPPAAALVKAGTNGSEFVLPGGRRLSPAGAHTLLGGFPAEIVPHPTLDVAFVNNLGYAKRGVEVVRPSDGAILQDVERPEAFHGMALAPDGSKLYVAGGDAGFVEVYDVDAASGMVTANAQVPITGYPSGLEVASDGTVLWVGAFQGNALYEVDRTTLAVGRSVTLPSGPIALLELPSRGEIYAALIRENVVAVIDRATFTVTTTIDLGGGGPIGLARRSDDSKVYATAADGDRIVAIDTATRTIATSVVSGDPDLVDDQGNLLPATSPSGLALDEAAGRLYVTRSGDNAVYVLDATTLATIGSIPTAWYPTDVARAGTRLLVTNGKGVGAGPTPREVPGQPESKARMTGSWQSIDLAGLDLAASTAAVESNLARPDEAYPVDCADVNTPVPSRSGGPTPIKHIVLIVRENKSYDSELGDLAGTDADPSLLMYGEEITPNIHAIARQFANHDNFYDDSESSVQGHFWLTSSYVNDYIERVSYFEDYRGNPGFSNDPVKAEGEPDFGTFFTHLIKHGVDFRIFGEVVGSTGAATNPAGQREIVADHIDVGFPGIFFATNIKDEDKGNYVGQWFGDNGLPSFSYVLLPNNHTNGLSPDALTPESMISDNDYGTGLLVEAISKLPEWESTAIFIVEDDTQGGADHVDLHRSILVVAGPWVKHAYTSHVHLSYPSLFRTFEHILGVPPLNRYTANATLLYDTFATRPNLATYTAEPRRIPDTLNRNAMRVARGSDVAARWSARMNFAAPDASADLGDILQLARFGRAPIGSRLRQVIDGRLPSTTEPRLEDGDGDADAYDREVAALARLLESNPRLRERFRNRRIVVDDDD